MSISKIETTVCRFKLIWIRIFKCMKMLLSIHETKGLTENV